MEKYLKSGRRVGNTTRMVDMFVQDFFNTNIKFRVYDHYGSREADKRILKLVLTRLLEEHNIQEKDVEVNWDKLTIKRK